MTKVPLLGKKTGAKVPIITKDTQIKPKEKLSSIKKEVRSSFGEQSKTRGVYAEKSALPDRRTSEARLDLGLAPINTSIGGSTKQVVPKKVETGKELRGEITPEALTKLKEQTLSDAAKYLRENPVGRNLAVYGVLPQDLLETQEELEKAGPILGLGTLLADVALPESAVLGGLAATSGGARKLLGATKKLAQIDNVDEVSTLLKSSGIKEEYVASLAPKIAKETDAKTIGKIIRDEVVAPEVLRKSKILGDPVLQVDNNKVIVDLPKMTHVQRAKLLDEVAAIPDKDFTKAAVHVSQRRIASTEAGKNLQFMNLAEAVKKYPEVRKVLDNIGVSVKTAQKSGVESLRKAANALVRESLPMSSRGKYLNAVSNIKTERNYVALAQRVESEVKKLDVVKQLRKGIRTAQDRIRYIKMVGEMSSLVVTDAKKTLGISEPVSRMDINQLEQLTKELDKRLQFKKDMGYKVPEPQITDAPDPNKKVFTDSFYTKIADKEQKTVAQKVSASASDMFDAIKEGADKYLGSISTRLGNISPDLKNTLRKMEYNLSVNKSNARKAVEPGLKAFKNMDKKDWAQLDVAFKNGDAEKIDYMSNKYGIKKELESIREVLDDLWVRAGDVGLDVRYMEDFMPRVVKDSKGLLEYLQKGDDWSIIEKALDERAIKLGRALDNDEKATIINTMIRGFKSGNISLSTPGALKARQIDYIDDKLNEFYAPTSEAIVNYIDRVNDAIEARKFFGKQMKNVKPEDINIEDSIGYYLLKLVNDGKIKPSQEKEVREILQARFGEKSTGKVVTAVKNLSYIDIMGSPLNAITQIGDLAFPLYKTGAWQTGKSFIKSVAGKTKFTKDDLGINKIAQEFTGATASSRAVANLFRIIGLEKMDAIGKNTLIDAMLSKMTSQAKRGDEKLLAELDKIFGNGANKVAKDLANDKVTEDVKLLMFNKLMDFQPIALSEMPEKYLSGGNGRVLYMLKTWTLKMFDVFRRESFQKIASGNKEEQIEGAKNLIKLAGALVIMNATADEIKDTITGKETSLKDRTVDNIAKLFGVNKYTLDMSEKEGLVKQLKNSILPPTQFLDNLYTDVAQSREVNELKSVKSIPVVGKLYYYWFGKGVNKQSDKGLKIKPLKVSGVKIKPLKLKTKIRPTN